LDRRRILGVLQIMRRLSHEADVLDSSFLRRVQDDRRNAGRTFVGRTPIDAPGLEERPRGGVGATGRDTHRPGMRSASQQRPERDDPPDATALGHAEERLRIGAPLLMWLRAAEQQQTVPAIRWTPREELAPWPVDLAIAIGPQPHLGPFLGEHEELF